MNTLKVQKMSKFFSPEGKIYLFMARLYDVLKLNMLWLLCSLPVVTAGAATIAAFSVTLRMAEDTEGGIAKSFWAAFKANLKQGIVMTFVTVFGVWAVYLNFEIHRATENIMFLIIAIISAYIVVFSLLYAYPLLARYENTVLNTLKNSFKISMRYFLRSIFVVVIAAIGIAVICWSRTTLIIGLLIGPVTIFLAMSGPTMAIFRIIDAANSEKDTSEN